MSIVEQLTYVTQTQEKWHKKILPKKELDEYHERLLLQGNIITYIIDGELLGYIEFWNISHEQLGRLICGIPILTDVEDILDGNISYINNMWISPDHRFGEAFEVLSSMFLVRNKDAEFFIAFKIIRNQRPLQVYTRQELIKLYTKGE